MKYGYWVRLFSQVQSKSSDLVTNTTCYWFLVKTSLFWEISKILTSIFQNSNRLLPGNESFPTGLLLWCWFSFCWYFWWLKRIWCLFCCCCCWGWWWLAFCSGWGGGPCPLLVPGAETPLLIELQKEYIKFCFYNEEEKPGFRNHWLQTRYKLTISALCITWYHWKEQTQTIENQTNLSAV